MNTEWEHFASPLDIDGLTSLDQVAAYHRVVEADSRVVAFLLALREGSGYDNPNYSWFSSSYDSFLYIDRVIVAGEQHGRGLGVAIYTDVFNFARESHVEYVVCEVNAVPPNEQSRAFHERRGFCQVGTQWIASGTKQVSMLAAPVGEPQVVKGAQCPK